MSRSSLTADFRRVPNAASIFTCARRQRMYRRGHQRGHEQCGNMPLAWRAQPPQRESRPGRQCARLILEPRGVSVHRCAPEAFRASMRTVSRTFEETAASFDLLFLSGPVDSLVRLPRGLASARSPARLLCGLEAAGTAVPARTAASCGRLAGVSSAISAHRQLKRPGLDPATLRIRKGGR